MRRTFPAEPAFPVEPHFLNSYQQPSKEKKLYWIYNICLVAYWLLQIPILIYRLVFEEGFYDRLKQSAGVMPTPTLQQIAYHNAIWVHAASVGEVVAASPIVRELKKKYPDEMVVVSVVTATGHRMAQRIIPEADGHIFFPFDLPVITERIVDIVNPKAIILIETELWPNFLRLAFRKKIPVMMMNGRISSRSMRRYSLIKRFTTRMLCQIRRFCMQSRIDEERIIAMGAQPKRCTITGITKFTQISLFSVLNNLSNISFDAPYATICGISKQEAADNFMPEIEAMGEENGWTPEETLKQLTSYYDGYHLCRKNMVDIFNPFSLINALDDRELRNYWASSGATSLLPKFVDDMEMKMEYFDHCFIEGDTLETSDVVNGGAELFLYQSGYLTIKGYDDGVYILGFPNFEVRKALYRVVVPALTMKSNSEVVSAQSFLRKMMQDGNTEEAKKALKALIADVPYNNKKMASMDMEERYRLIMSTIFRALGFRVEVERMLATGRIDMIVEVPSYIYVMELKLSNNGGISAAESQMKEKSYTEPFKADKRKVIALAVELDEKGKGLIDWKEVDESL